MRSILSLMRGIFLTALLLGEPICSQTSPSLSNLPTTKAANQGRPQPIKPGIATLAKQALLVDYATRHHFAGKKCQ